jgi:hypothetical protein
MQDQASPALAGSSTLINTTTMVTTHFSTTTATTRRSTTTATATARRNTSHSLFPSSFQDLNPRQMPPLYCVCICAGWIHHHSLVLLGNEFRQGTLLLGT